jgi:hypothetical protein
MCMRAIVVVAILAGTALASSQARAYCLYRNNTGRCEGFATTTIKYRISSNLTDAAIIKAIDDAFATWQAVTCTGLTLQKDTATFPVTTPMGSNSGYIAVYWVKQASELQSPMTQDDYAFWYHGYNPSGDRASFAMFFNAFKYNWNTTGGSASSPFIFDVQNVLTQFVGLALGLDYSKTAGTVMSNDIAYGQTSKRTLTQDDINAVSAMYRGTCSTPPGMDVGCVTCTVGPVGPGGDGPKSDGGATKQDKGGGSPGSEGGTAKNDGGGGTSGCNPQCKTDELCVYQNNAYTCVNGGNGDNKGGCGCLVAGRARGSHAALTLLAMAAMALLLLARRRS